MNKLQITEFLFNLITSEDNLDNAYSLLTDITDQMNKKQLTSITKIIKNKSYEV
tara:strand:- start:285 stop:446 length:162 start_codon:yes stop_codon:yes gene_type:complete